MAEEKTYSMLDLGGNQVELVAEEAFALYADNEGTFLNPGVDWADYVAWFKGKENPVEDKS